MSIQSLDDGGPTGEARVPLFVLSHGVPDDVPEGGVYTFVDDLETALVLINRQEVFRGRRTPSLTVIITQSIAQLAAFIGIVAGFWHITWVAGVGMLGAGFVAVLVHSAGWWRLEVTRRPTT